MTTVILIEGTWGGDWARPRSPFRRMLAANGFYAVRFEGWSGDVSGVPSLLSKGKHRDWIAGGFGLGYQLRGMNYDDVNIVCHSHGIAPVLYQLVRMKVPIRRLISVCSPVRGDLQTQASGAVKRIGRWRHVSSANGDPWQRLGELFDGHINWQFGRGQRRWPQAHENVSIPGIGHSGLLNDPRFLDLWKTDGMLDFLAARTAAPLTEVPDGRQATV